MRGPRRPPDVAGGAPLQSHLLPLHGDGHVASRGAQVPCGGSVALCACVCMWQEGKCIRIDRKLIRTQRRNLSRYGEETVRTEQIRDIERINCPNRKGKDWLIDSSSVEQVYLVTYHY